MEQPTRRRPRRRPLETCGGVILSMARVVYTRSQTLKKKKNLASWLLRKLFEFVIFFVSMTTPFHRHFLAILSVADDHILALQDAIETYFPSSSFVFVKIFDFLIVVESFPEKFDGFLKKLPSLMNRVAWLDWLLVHAISWLGLLVNVLGRWRDKNKGTKEKEITVDRSFSRSGSVSEEEEEEKTKFGTEKKVSYKEALQRGSSGEDGGGSTGRSSSSRGDPILELFETGWIQNPIKRSSRSADSLTFSRSESYST
ncbi:hypothetical protein ISN44_As07g015510 [Arabidopsis suecica]|uniref:Transmembrane protein n=1 Tax=Arabidopsis suecica TaxID=45249 RepID=A0A8T2BUD9_ARASU|nr:hypothetical protein ISN44_As07g015510 [Arabidopsis suecica]